MKQSFTPVTIVKIEPRKNAQNNVVNLTGLIDILSFIKVNKKTICHAETFVFTCSFLLSFDASGSLFEVQKFNNAPVIKSAADLGVHKSQRPVDHIDTVIDFILGDGQRRCNDKHAGCSGHDIDAFFQYSG